MERTWLYETLMNLQLQKAMNKTNKKLNFMRKIISFMHISLDGFVAGQIGRAHV